MHLLATLGRFDLKTISLNRFFTLIRATSGLKNILWLKMGSVGVRTLGFQASQFN
jgi:hypothetical protein